MKTFNNFGEALAWQKTTDTYDVNTRLATGVVNIDRIQFSLGEVLWVILADGYSLDDYEEYVTQYGITSSGAWAVVEGGHCSCYGWEEMKETDITYYESLDLLLKCDKNADVITRHAEALKEAFTFLEINA